MLTLILGVAVLAATIAALIYCMPRGGKSHRLIGTEWEPYLGVALTSGLVLGVMMLIGAFVGGLT
jgi:uncharacterized membrane protein